VNGIKIPFKLLKQELRILKNLIINNKSEISYAEEKQAMKKDLIFSNQEKESLILLDIKHK